MKNLLFEEKINDAVHYSIMRDELFALSQSENVIRFESTSIKLSQLFEECFYLHPFRELFIKKPFNSEAWILATGMHVIAPDDAVVLLDMYFRQDNYLGLPTLKLLSARGMTCWENFLREKIIAYSNI